MSMNDALNTIEAKAEALLTTTHASPDAFRAAYVASGIIHDLRWLSPDMEFTAALGDMEYLHTMDAWEDKEEWLATAYLKGVALFLEGVRIGYRVAGNGVTA